MTTFYETIKIQKIPVLDIHEIAGGKLAALFARHAARDLFDTHQLLARGCLDKARLRLAFVLYGAMNRKDWRTVSVDDLRFDPGEIENQLLPLLRKEFASICYFLAPSNMKIGHRFTRKGFNQS